LTLFGDFDIISKLLKKSKESSRKLFKIT